MKIYVGNLGFDVTEETLHQLFSSHGQVASTSIALDRATQRSRGFAFVEMASPEEAQAAIQALNGTELGQRNLAVSQARPREERSFSNRGASRPRNWNNQQRPEKKGPAKRSKRQRR